jgi:hypothetical protein
MHVMLLLPTEANGGASYYGRDSAEISRRNVQMPCVSMCIVLLVIKGVR